MNQALQEAYSTLTPLVSAEGALLGVQTEDGKPIYLQAGDNGYRISGLEYIDPSVPEREQWAAHESWDRPVSGGNRYAEEGLRHETVEGAMGYLTATAAANGFVIEDLPEGAVFDVDATEQFSDYEIQRHGHNDGGAVAHFV
ncbi:MAG: hypothetical protein AAB436_00435 [Patescibacteria group bacterium]